MNLTAQISFFQFFYLDLLSKVLLAYKDLKDLKYQHHHLYKVVP